MAINLSQQLSNPYTIPYYTKEKEMQPKYPITVQLTGHDGNAFGILARVCRALTDNGVDSQDVNAYQAEATSGDYEHLLLVTSQWVEVE